ncbi:MAG TPA: acyl-CoA dehydrogenase family protein [Syntrophomonadaceae bacterium]|nr:acyl-CoA dehydrogenase family protein [Syntrophomonadaceae bacterium]
MFRHTIPSQETDLVMMAREITQNFISPNAIELDQRVGGSTDFATINLLAEHNLLAPNLPSEYGGLGISHLATAMILEEIAVGCAGIATIISTNLHAISPIITAGTLEQKQEYLPKLTNKTPHLAALTLIEHKPNLDIFAHPEAMSISRSSIKVKKGSEEGCTVLRGHKDYVMNANIADFFVTMYSSTPYGDKKDLQVIVLPMDTPGVAVGEVRNTLGLRSCSANEVVFDNVEIANNHKIGKPGSGLLVFMQNLDRSVAYTGAICLGVARAAYETALKTSKIRMYMGRPSFEESAVSYALVDMATKLNAARLSVHLACSLIDSDLDFSQAASKSKVIASSVAQEVTAKAMEIVGGRAYLYGHESEKYLRDAKMLSIVDGSEQFHRSLIAAQF